MLSLHLFGGAALEGTSGPLTGPGAQKRRVALLARLALAPRQGYSRDKLIACFWPEHDEEKGRHLLSDSLYRLNQSLGGYVIHSGIDGLRVNHARLICDVVEFEAALEQGDRAAAVRFYRGPFLDGFFIDGAPDFERWVEQERERLSLAFGAALEKLAETSQSRGEYQEAVSWWRRLAAHDPMSSRVALRLYQTLIASGDRAAALHQAKAHEALLRSELGAEPALAFTAQLPALSRLTSPGAVITKPVRIDHHRPVVPEPIVAVIPHRREPVHRLPLHLREVDEVWLLRLLVVIVGLLLALSWWIWHAGTRGLSPPSLRTLAVLPFVDLSPEQNRTWFADGITEELIATLSEEPLRVSSRTSVFALREQGLDVRAVGHRLKVDHIIEGSVRQSGNRVRITAQLVSTRDGYHLWSGQYDRELADVLEVQGEIARAVASALRITLGLEPGPDAHRKTSVPGTVLSGADPRQSFPVAYPWQDRLPDGMQDDRLLAPLHVRGGNPIATAP